MQSGPQPDFPCSCTAGARTRALRSTGPADASGGAAFGALPVRRLACSAASVSTWDLAVLYKSRPGSNGLRRKYTRSHFTSCDRLTGDRLWRAAVAGGYVVSRHASWSIQVAGPDVSPGELISWGLAAQRIKLHRRLPSLPPSPVTSG